jgi:hypothetical protein
VRGQRHAPAAFYLRERPGTHCPEAGWAPGSVWTGAENLAPTGIRSPDHPARTRPTELFYAAVNIFVLTVTCSSTEHTAHCCLSTATVVTGTRHNVTLYVHCQPYKLSKWFIHHRGDLHVAVIEDLKPPWRIIRPTLKYSRADSRVRLWSSTTMSRTYPFSVIRSGVEMDDFKALSRDREECLLCLSFPSVCPHVSLRLPVDGFRWNFILTGFWKKSPSWLKSGRNIGHCTWGPMYALLFPATLNPHKSTLFEW